MKPGMVGLAGEFRVMSELLLRGHNPAKSYLEDGADLILENGLRIEVKSAHKGRWGRGIAYNFDLRRGNRKSDPLHDTFDYVICWCIDDDWFYIIPNKILTAWVNITVYTTKRNFKSKSKYAPYREAWTQLNEERR